VRCIVGKMTTLADVLRPHYRTLYDSVSLVFQTTPELQPHTRVTVSISDETLHKIVCSFGKLNLFKVADLLVNPLKLFALIDSTAAWQPSIAIALAVHVSLN
jgi:hypothetical protein